MSLRYVVVCDGVKCYRQQGILTDKVKIDGGGVYISDLPGIGWKLLIENGKQKHYCPFCSPKKKDN